MRVNIDGREIETKHKKTILELARENDIYIPSLCDFKGLEPFSGCRLCLVKVEGMKGYVPSCSVFVKDGMKVKTKTSADEYNLASVTSSTFSNTSYVKRGLTLLNSFLIT